MPTYPKDVLFGAYINIRLLNVSSKPVCLQHMGNNSSSISNDQNKACFSVSLSKMSESSQ